MYLTLCYCAIGFLLCGGLTMRLGPAINNRSAPPPYKKTSTLSSTLRSTDALLHAGDSFSGVNRMAFTTKDRDNDVYEMNCAKLFKGGWWYSKCHEANLNGLYLNGTHMTYADGIEWKTWKGFKYSLPEVEMKIRRI